MNKFFEENKRCISLMIMGGMVCMLLMALLGTRITRVSPDAGTKEHMSMFENSEMAYNSPLTSGGAQQENKLDACDADNTPSYKCNWHRFVNSQ